MAGLLEANGIYNVKLLVNRVRPDMIQKVSRHKPPVDLAIAGAQPRGGSTRPTGLTKCPNPCKAGEARKVLCLAFHRPALFTRSRAQNDMMSVKDVQEMLGIPLLGAIPEDPQVSTTSHG